MEPWIQWFSVYSGKKAEDHGVYRLGDCDNYTEDLIFSKIENLNYKVGAVSPMNAPNYLKNPSYFIPDPWIKSQPSNDFWSKKITNLIRLAVNNNTGNFLSFKTIINILLILVRFANFKNTHLYLYYFITSLKHKWRKALFLDLLLNDIHLCMIKNKKPNFTTIFLNAGAHIQHHHLLKSEFLNSNTKIDPIKEVYKLYDRLINQYIDNKHNDYEYIIYTGLSQEINQDPATYYRLKNHEKFLNYFDIKFKSVNPRMSRDFELEFDNQIDTNIAATKLALIKTNNDEGCQIFKTIDVRDCSIFITLTYSKKIDLSLEISNKSKTLNFLNSVNFVAEKNGNHSEIGYIFYSKNLAKLFGENELNVKDIHDIILNYFNE